MQNKNNKKSTQSSNVINSLLTVKPDIVHIDSTSKDKNLETPLEGESVEFKVKFFDEDFATSSPELSKLCHQSVVTSTKYNIPQGKSNISQQLYYDTFLANNNMAINTGERFFDIGEKFDGLTMEQMTQFVGEDNSIKKGGMTVISDEFLKTLSEKNEKIITIENPIEIDIPNNIDDTNEMLEKNAQEYARKHSARFIYPNTIHSLSEFPEYVKIEEDFTTLPTEKEFKAKAIQLKNTGNFKKLGHAQNALAVKYGFKDFNSIKNSFKTQSINNSLDLVKKGDFILFNHIYSSNSIPLILICESDIKIQLEKIYETEINFLSDYTKNDELLFIHGNKTLNEKYDTNVFKIYTKEEYKQLPLIVRDFANVITLDTHIISNEWDIINFYGRTGSGKTTLIKNLKHILNNKDTLILDIRNSGELLELGFDNANIIKNTDDVWKKGDFFNDKLLIKLENEIKRNNIKYVILEDAAYFFGVDSNDNRKKIFFDLVSKNTKSKIKYIFTSHTKVDFRESLFKKVKHFQKKIIKKDEEKYLTFVTQNFFK